MTTGAVGGTSSSDRSGATERAEAEHAAAEKAAAERAAAAERSAAAARAAAQPPLSTETARTLSTVAGRSSFESPRVDGPAAARAAGQVEATNTILPAVRSISVAAQRVEVANAEVAKLEETLAKDLTQLSSALSPKQLGEYAAAYRSEPGHAEIYAEARDSANDLAATLRDQLPDAATAAATARGPEAETAASWLDESVTRATEALAVSVRQSPTANTELAHTLQEAQSRLSVDVLGLTQKALETYGETGRAFSDIAAKAGQSFGVLNEGLGIIGTATDTLQLVDRIREGDGRAEHYVGAAAGVAEVGIGVLSIAGVTVAAPITAVVGLVAGGASVVSGVRDMQASQQAIEDRLKGLGYDSATASGLAHGNSSSFEALRALGLDAGQVQHIAAASPRAAEMGASLVESFGAAARTLGLSPQDTVRFLEAMGPLASDVAGTLAMKQAQFDPQTRAEWLEVLRPANPAFGSDAATRAAEWLDAQ